MAEMAVYNPFDFFLEPSAEHFPFSYEAWQLRELQPFLHADPLTPRLARYLESIDRRRRRTIDMLVDVNRHVQQDISYVIRLDPGVQDVERTLELASGSCRDTTWLLVQLFRHLGLAARFVSGYLIQLVPDVKALDGPAGADRDFTDLHAWCEVYLPGAGWIGLDPTSGLLAGEGHIPLACTPEPMSAAPVSGGVEPCEVDFVHEMSVRRIVESPRVTKPYTDAQWEAILACGRAVDADLAAGDVRLTMGGEPTFVSATDRDADEWNTAALGPTKRARAVDLLRRLKQRYGANGFVHFGQGKWYPGEPLPRWALGCYWRADGEPAWTDASLFADEQHPDGHGAGRRRALHHRARRAAGRDRRPRAGGLRRRLVLPLARTEAAGERGSLRRAPRRRTGARPLAPRLHARSRRRRRLRPADSARGRTGRTLGDGAAGSCATSGSIWFPATRRWDSGCRSTRCRGRLPATASRSTSSIRSRHARRSRRRRRSGAPRSQPQSQRVGAGASWRAGSGAAITRRPRRRTAGRRRHRASPVAR